MTTWGWMWLTRNSEPVASSYCNRQAELGGRSPIPRSLPFAFSDSGSGSLGSQLAIQTSSSPAVPVSLSHRVIASSAISVGMPHTIVALPRRSVRITRLPSTYIKAPSTRTKLLFVTGAGNRSTTVCGVDDEDVRRGPHDQPIAPLADFE